MRLFIFILDAFRMAEMLVAKRLNFVPESAKIRDVDTKLLGDYVYQVRSISCQ